MPRIFSPTQATLAVGLTALGALTVSPAAHAQTASFPDVDANHWAYQAVQDLADKGYVKGYPDGKFLGKRAMTRYEFATVIDRIVQTIDELSTKANAAPPTTPTGTPVTQDDLNKINALVDTFRTQLDAIQSQINGDPAKGTKGFQEQLDALRQEVVQTKAQLAKTMDTANNSYGSGANRKFQISGFVQTGFIGGPRSKDRYPQGVSRSSGAYNGTYAQGGNAESFEIRRARLKFTGAVTANTKYSVQIDASGAITTGAAPNQQVTAKEGYIAYTFGSGDPTKYPTLTVGQFVTPFGYLLPAPIANSYTPDRALAFSEAAYGLFNSQDYEKGIQLSYNTPSQLLGFLPAGLKLSAALVNGTGRATEDVDRRVDQVYRIAYQTKDRQFGVGASYYHGQIDVPPTIPGAAGSGPAFVGRHRELLGFDAQFVSNAGPFLLAEFVNGTFEQRTAFGVPTGAPLAPSTLTPGTEYAPGNRVEGYYAQGGYTFGPTGAHPLSLFISYDKFRRAVGGTGSSAAFDDENIGGGVLYNLDRATRLRVFYIRPSQVAHDPATTEPPKIAQTDVDLQVRF